MPYVIHTAQARPTVWSSDHVAELSTDQRKSENKTHINAIIYLYDCGIAITELAPFQQRTEREKCLI